MHAENILVIVAVVVWVLARQLRARPVGAGGRRALLVPLVLVVMALRSSDGLVDPHHRAAATLLLVVGVAVEAAFGCAWAYSTRLWADAQGAHWAKGTPATLGIWLVMAAVRAGLFALGSSMGVHQGEAPLLLGLAVLLAVRSAVLRFRAQRSLGGPASLRLS